MEQEDRRAFRLLPAVGRKVYVLQVPLGLVNAIANGECLPFVGAGFSLNATPPPGRSIPLWDEVVVAARNRLNGIDSTDALGIMEEFERQFDRIELINFWRSLIPENLEPHYVHELLVSLFGFTTYVTTNYDNVIEAACRKIGKPVRTIATQYQLQLYGSSNDRGLVIKMHGDFENPEQLVITQSDYDTYFEKRQVFGGFLAEEFRTKAALLLGYSGRDPDYRQLVEYRNTLDNLSRKIYVLELDSASDEIKTMDEAQNVVKIILGCLTYSPSQVLIRFLRSLYNAVQRCQRGVLVYGPDLTVKELRVNSDIRLNTPSAEDQLERLEREICSDLPLSFRSFYLQSDGALLDPRFEDTRLLSVAELVEVKRSVWWVNHVLPFYAVGNGDYWALDLHDFYEYDECHVTYVCHSPQQCFRTEMTFADWLGKGITSHWGDYQRLQESDE